MPKSKSSSARWLQRQSKDPYVKQAKQAGYRSRAAFKLLEIQKKDRIIKQGMTIVDLGAAPGGWSQVAQKLAGKHGRVFALDILPMDPLPDVEFIQGDFGEEETAKQLLDLVSGNKIDLVISDIAPNISGIRAVDQPSMMYLAECVFEFAYQVLQPGGAMLVKVFQGEGFDQYLRTLREHFEKVRSRKPKASRPESREIYLLATGFQRPQNVL